MDTVYAGAPDWPFLILAALLFLSLLALSRTVFRLRDVRKQLNSAKQDTDGSKDFLLPILEHSPNSIAVIRSTGGIEYVNPATEKVLGSSQTVGLNVLGFDTVAGTPLENAIRNAIDGKASSLVDYRHVSATTGKEKYLNVVVIPFRKGYQGVGNDVIMITGDVSYEVELSKRKERNFLATFRSFAGVVDARDTYTGEHSNNVYDYTQTLLTAMGIGAVEQKQILTAAMLHDIGKIGVPDSILRKDGKLDNWEYSVMKEHPVIGSRLLVDIDEYYDISLIVRHHHERWDGSGYPDRLEGTEIPFGAQVIAIADAYDAITSERVYRNARTQEEAFAELEACRWKQFNGDLVPVFIEAIRKQNQELRQRQEDRDAEMME